jgi:electron transfer flavoprotein beta subunit
MPEFHIVVCGSVVPDPLQTLQPAQGPQGWGLKNEMMLPAVLDPWAGHSLYEAAELAKNNPGSRVILVSIGPKAKLQQVMMNIAQKVPFEFVAMDGPAGGFVEPRETAEALKNAIEGVEGLDMSKLLLFGGWQSASRGAGATMQILGEMLGIYDQFQGVDKLEVLDDGVVVHERVEGGAYLVTRVSGPPIVCGWATGNLPEPPNNPQVGMQNMQKVMPALQKAQPVQIGVDGVRYVTVELPSARRDTRIVKDVPAEDIAKEIVDWIRE